MIVVVEVAVVVVVVNSNDAYSNDYNDNFGKDDFSDSVDNIDDEYNMIRLMNVI